MTSLKRWMTVAVCLLALAAATTALPVATGEGEPQSGGSVVEQYTPNDPFFVSAAGYQWNFTHIGMQKAWDLSGGGSPSTVIAVLDTGVAYENYRNFQQAPDLAGTHFVAGYDFVSDDDHANDSDSHGTHVTGTIAQTTNNGTGCAGIAFNCSIMPVRVLNKRGSGSLTDLAEGIIWAADHGAHVINMSLSAPVYSAVVHDAIVYAHNKGVVMVAATGNDNEIGADAIGYPARDPLVIAVGATRYDNAVAWYSNKGPTLDIVAPGGDMSVDQNGDGYGDGILQNTFNPNTTNVKDFSYWFFEGSSMAAPHVAAVAALIHDVGVTDPDVIRAILLNTAIDLGPPGFDEMTGHGLLNAAAALEAALSLEAGDANLDGKIDSSDLALWQQNYDPVGAGVGKRWMLGDFNDDGKIDSADLALWQQNYDPLGSSSLGGMTNVPEPATLALLLAGAFGLLLKRKQRY